MQSKTLGELHSQKHLQATHNRFHTQTYSFFSLFLRHKQTLTLNQANYHQIVHLVSNNNIQTNPDSVKIKSLSNDELLGIFSLTFASLVKTFASLNLCVIEPLRHWLIKP